MSNPTRTAARIGLAVALSLGVSAGPAARPAAGQPKPKTRARIVLLHHSTGECIWNGGVAGWFEAYNAARKTGYRIVERAFPKDAPYGWENYPYDYWNIWVRHAGAKPYKDEPTLEILTRTYDVIVFKHCFPVSAVEPDTGRGDVTSSEKRLENYKLQYEALKRKMRQFPNVRFLVWTGAALVQRETNAAAAKRARAFSEWVRRSWDEKGDNIYVWDFRQLETDGGLYLKDAHARAATDSHPDETFSRKVAPLLCQRIVDVIAGRGDTSDITGRGGKPLPPPSERPTPPEAPSPPVQPTATGPAPAATLPAAGAGKWVFDDAEGGAPADRRWLKGVTYVREGTGRAIRIDFSAGAEEDWGEYGKQRIVRSRPPAKNRDVKAYRYLALRVKADQEMHVVLGLITLPDPTGSPHQSHFSFNAYLRRKPGPWAWMVFDLTKLEPAAEGAEAYEKAGKPTRPMQLTALRLCAHVKHEKAQFLLDDIVFLRELPASLRRFVQAP